MKQTTLYLAGGLFNAAERLHNLYLERFLKDLGYKVILPQREAAKHIVDGVPNLPKIKAECKESALSALNIYVGSADGADADSGTCVEYGLAIGTKGDAVVYRTDIRTDTEREIGVNAMLTLEGTVNIYSLCYITELNQADAYYQNLAAQIHLAVQVIVKAQIKRAENF